MSPTVRKGCRYNKSSRDVQTRTIPSEYEENDSTNHKKLATESSSELQLIQADGTKLRNLSDSFRYENKRLQSHNKELLQALEEDRMKFEEELNELQRNIKRNDNRSIEMKKFFIDQQEKNNEEMKDLKSTIDILEKKNIETSLKVNKYKRKLKYAIRIIKELNTMLMRYTTQPVVVSAGTQTGYECSNHQIHLVQQNDPYSNKINDGLPEKEVLLLSDIFFRSRSFCEELFDLVQH
ncbi:unnamed protein product [Phaedon cochleariae]|uniref:Uncharacterized protein n=1 Tax=Phaedon cochleariae TaxID=80249 RepID=A0A9P0GHH9_PHACE|nr:unnamed protein product [Phaedon cochleariae]